MKSVEFGEAVGVLAFINHNNKPMKVSRILILMLLTFLSSLLLSPKFLFPPAAWILPILLIYLFRRAKIWQTLVWVYLPITLGAIIANYEVVPYPVPVLLSIMLIGNFLGLIPLFLDRIFYKRLPDVLASLVFPASAVILDYWAASGPQGVWGNVVNTQFAFLPLLQLSAFTGIWGIGFLIYWMGPVVNHWIEHREHAQSLRLPIGYASVLVLVLLGGGLRLTTSPPAEKSLKIAGISIDNLYLFEYMYEAAKGVEIQLPERISQTDPVLQELNSVYPVFFAQPKADRFAPVLEGYEASLKHMLAESERAIGKGAKAVVWSEASVQCLEFMEEVFVERAQSFAAKHEIYLFFPMAVFQPDKFDTGQPFLENKVLSIDPHGEVLYSYFKNVPVPDLEPSVPGDGKIPVFETPYGKISTAICYDADFPAMLRQLSQNETELLLLPAGDWDAIDPIHGRMAL
ncbi:MAG: nitrilase-related carbon-nitrogen hydrolase, partial [Bacteroidota bacterium]